MSKHEFQTEVNQLLHLMVHSLYSNKEIFLRELISNASDALDKLEYLKLTDERYKELEEPSKIVISFDKEKKTLTVSDTGIGMTPEQKERLLHCLFEIAAAYGEISLVEENEIRKIAEELRFDHAQFSEIRSKFNKHRTILR